MISVILCTYNPRHTYLRRTLEALRQQTIPCAEWELLLIDNRSDTPLANALNLSWHAKARVVREDKLGLTPARLRGIREAVGDVLVFVDDDNVLDSNFLEKTRRIAEELPFLGSWSGQCRPEFEEPPPEWTRRYWGNLMIREFESDHWSNLPRFTETMPCGAGLCVRREVAQRYLQMHESGLRKFQFDRTGDSLVSGGDNDLAACACDVGLGVGLIASLRLIHLIPRDRLSLDYLSRLAEGIHFSGVLLDQERGIATPTPGRARLVLDAIRRLLIDRRDALIQRSATRGRRRALKLIEASKKS